MIFLLLSPFYKLAITDNNYNKVINLTYKVPALLLAFSPYCQHCQAVHPSWVKLEEKLATNTNILISSLDCESYNRICNEFKIRQYPTFAEVINGETRFINHMSSFEALSLQATQTIKENKGMIKDCSRLDTNRQIPAISSIVVYETTEMPTACDLINVLKNNKVDYPMFASFGPEAGVIRKCTKGTTCEELTNPYSLSMAIKFAQKDNSNINQNNTFANSTELNGVIRIVKWKNPYAPVILLVLSILLIMIIMIIYVLITPPVQYQRPELVNNRMTTPENFSDNDDGVINEDACDGFTIEAQPTDKVEKQKYNEV